MKLLERLMKLWEEIQESVSNEDLCFIVWAIMPLSELAGQKLLERGSKNDLLFILREKPSLREQAGQKLLEQYGHELSNDDLYWIMEYAPLSREKAAQKLLEKEPSDYHLRCIYGLVEPIRDKVLPLIRRRECIGNLLV